MMENPYDNFHRQFGPYVRAICIAQANVQRHGRSHLSCGFWSNNVQKLVSFNPVQPQIQQASPRLKANQRHVASGGASIPKYGARRFQCIARQNRASQTWSSTSTHTALQTMVRLVSPQTRQHFSPAPERQRRSVSLCACRRGRGGLTAAHDGQSTRRRSRCSTSGARARSRVRCSATCCARSARTRRRRRSRTSSHRRPRTVSVLSCAARSALLNGVTRPRDALLADGDSGLPDVLDDPEQAGRLQACGDTRCAARCVSCAVVADRVVTACRGVHPRLPGV